MWRSRTKSKKLTYTTNIILIKTTKIFLESQTKDDGNLLQKKPTAKYASKLKKINGKDIKPKDAAFWSFVYKSAGKYGSKIPRLNALNEELF